ncbi:hypothetical protein HMPREF3208_00415 [Gardnerella vaginalis]|uniref:Uncharacterized protein n=1 Tax=Gardnerella vaginalis TaxID=2702 RepID=A0A133P0W3_GARVA|nr:hypothetical protein HMPREF3208_00415 [Gardnerella vaginalis]
MLISIIYDVLLMRMLAMWEDTKVFRLSFATRLLLAIKQSTKL